MSIEKGIIWLLKNSNERFSVGNKWIYWDEDTNEWVVMAHKLWARNSIEIIRTESETLAVKFLIET